MINGTEVITHDQAYLNSGEVTVNNSMFITRSLASETIVSNRNLTKKMRILPNFYQT